MFPLYVGVGKLAALLHLPQSVLEHVLEVLARAALVFALWRFCRAFAAGTSRRAVGVRARPVRQRLRVVRGALSMLRGGGVYTGSWSYETNGFGLLFAAPHVPLAMAATLEMAHDVLRAAAHRVAARGCSKSGCCPRQSPCSIRSICRSCSRRRSLAGVVFWRSERGYASLAGALAACLAALPVLVADDPDLQLRSVLAGDLQRCRTSYPARRRRSCWSTSD